MPANAGSRTRRKANTKSSAVTARPSDHLWSRSLKVYTRPSSSMVQLSAAPGTMLPSAASVVSPRNMSPTTRFS